MTYIKNNNITSILTAFQNESPKENSYELIKPPINNKVSQSSYFSIKLKKPKGSNFDLDKILVFPISTYSNNITDTNTTYSYSYSYSAISTLKEESNTKQIESPTFNNQHRDRLFLGNKHGLNQYGEIGKLFSKSDIIAGSLYVNTDTPFQFNNDNKKSSALTSIESLYKKALTKPFHNKDRWIDSFKVLDKISDTSNNPLEMKDFQDLFVIAWTANPTEKGSYFIEIEPGSQLESRILSGIKTNLTTRKSSHLTDQYTSSAAGDSGFTFLTNYKELLVQILHTNDKTLLFLKAEGNRITYGIEGLLHGAGWAKKKLTGSGRTVSKNLNILAKENLGVRLRDAENYNKNWHELIKKLNLLPSASQKKPTIESHPKTVTVAQVVTALLQTSVEGQTPRSNPFIANDTHALADTVFQEIEHLSKAAHTLGVKGVELNLLEIAFQLIKQPNRSSPQFFMETHLSLNDLNMTVENFKEYAMAKKPLIT